MKYLVRIKIFSYRQNLDCYYSLNKIIEDFNFISSYVKSKWTVLQMKNKDCHWNLKNQRNQDIFKTENTEKDAKRYMMQ